MAASKQSFIYNSAALVPNVDNPFNIDKPTAIRAAGLTVDVPIYFAVGETSTCGGDEFLWEPLVSCGQPVTVGPDNNNIVLAIPGKYRLGPDDVPFVPAGDVHITKQENVNAWQLPKACPVEVTVEPCLPLSGGVQTAW